MKVLIIEDEKRLADFLKKGLNQESFIVDVSYRGDLGFDLALNEKYDIILLDLMLPGMDGISICKNLREENIQTPILMLTAKSQTEDKITGLNIGADDYLAKPFSFDELLARIKAITRRPQQINKNKVEIKELNILLDLNKYEVYKKDQKIDLSRKEFNLLYFLVLNKNKVLSKDEIINNVWEFDSDVLPNTVEVYIKYLRNKFGKNLIKTVRGFGYKLNV